MEVLEALLDDYPLSDILGQMVRTINQWSATDSRIPDAKRAEWGQFAAHLEAARLIALKSGLELPKRDG